MVPCEPWLQPLCKREAALNNQKLHFLAAAPAFDNFATARQVAGFDYGPFLGTTRGYLGLNWVLFINYSVVSPPSSTNPHSVPNSSPVPLCNVSWGLGVYPVLVRSVSPCRLVLEVRLFPSPHALFWPSARRLCPFFSSSCL